MALVTYLSNMKFEEYVSDFLQRELLETRIVLQQISCSSFLFLPLKILFMFLLFPSMLKPSSVNKSMEIKSLVGRPIRKCSRSWMAKFMHVWPSSFSYQFSTAQSIYKFGYFTITIFIAFHLSLLTLHQR